MNISKTILFLASPILLFSLNDFELINAQSAWNEGITGKGVNIGIIDTGFDTNHPALKNQFIDVISSSDRTHGTQVASVALGEKIGSNPHGIAYNAKFYGLPFRGHDAYNYFKNKNVKIINNSWGYSIYPAIKLHVQNDEILSDASLDTPSYVLGIIERQLGYVNGLARLARENNILSVFATGNDSMSSASISAALPRYDESLRSWLAVGAIDSAHITKNKDGKFVLSSKAATDFSNGFKGISLFGIVAPGENVAVANPGGGYGRNGGTSFAAPMVSGAAALVLEKFPFLNGAQIADVLLSTANKDYIAPKVILKESYVAIFPKYTIIYIDHTGNKPTNDQARRDLLAEGYDEYQINMAFKNPLERELIQTLGREEVFGQGILDIQKALGGIALLDANRLNQEDVYTLNHQTSVLLYSIDTQEYSATFSNDISQKKWDSKYHHPQARNLLPANARGLDVGLLKKGSGKLELLGENTYKGITFIQQGTIALNKRANGSGGILGSDTFVGTQGKLQGNGIIKGDVYNDGIVSPGNADFATLTIEGNYTQNKQATLEIHFGIEEAQKPKTYSNKASADSVSIIKDHAKLKATSYTIQGGSLMYTPIKGRFYIEGEMIPITLDTNLTNQINNFTNIAVQSNVSQTINFILQNPFNILIAKRSDAYWIPEIESDLHKTLQAISSDPNLSQNYKNYFAFVDSASRTQYVDALKSLDGNLYLQNTKEIIHNQLRLSLSDITLLLESSKEDKILFTPSFGYMQDSQYHSYIFSLDMQGRKKIVDNFSLSGFLNFSNFQTNDSSANLSSQVFSGGLSLSYDFKVLEIFGGIGTGFGYNTFKRESAYFSAKGNYFNALGLAHIGLGKTYKLNNSFTLMPIVWIQDTYAYQSDWKEKSEIFGKSYSIAHYNVLDASVGLRVGYEKQDIGFGISGFYTRHLLGNPLQNQTNFFDYPTQIIHQRYTFDPNLYRVGADFSYAHEKFLMSLKVDSDLAKNLWGLRGSLTLGARF